MSDIAFKLDTWAYDADIVEPETDAKDDHGDHYTDGYYANFCAEGAATVTIHEWRHTYTEAYPSGTYKEPLGSGHRVETCWKPSAADWSGGYQTNLRSYLMYLAIKVDPDGWQSPGMVSFGSSNLNWNAMTGTTELKGGINWEITNHASNFNNAGYYTYQTKSSLTKSSLKSKVSFNVGYDAVPVVLNVNTGPALGWSHNAKHSVAVVGFNEATDQFYIIDTCGHDCSWGHNTNGHGAWVDIDDVWSGLIGIVQ